MVKPTINLDADQQHALDLIQSGENVFLTGKAGSGKSAVLTGLCALNPEDTAFLAPTGLAAMNIGGSTVHRFFGLHASLLPRDYVPTLEPEQVALINAVRTIVVDEISMVRSDVFSAMDCTLRHLAPADRKHLAFGGKRIVVVGDFYQLPPVVTSPEDGRQLVDDFGGIYAFQTRSWDCAYFQMVTLSKPHRHASDPDYLEVLDALRRGSVDQSGRDLQERIAWLNQRVRICAPPRDVPNLCTTRRAAAEINHTRDSELPGAVVVSTAVVSGQFDEDACPTETRLEFRVGSRVVLVNNRYGIDGSLEYANGALGTVVYPHRSERAVDVELDNGKCVTVRTHLWLKYKYIVVTDFGTGQPRIEPKVIGSFSQLPMKLAYALTVHKAQGMTMEGAHVSLGERVFASGQLYAALSRCRSLKGLSLDREVRPIDVKVGPAVVGFHDSLLAAEQDRIESFGADPRERYMIFK
jgi:ATP-dependent exoDNAse (exonuclease V) alpha subunit